MIQSFTQKCIDFDLNGFPCCIILFLGYETLDIPAERVITAEQLCSPLPSVVTDVAGAAHSTGGHGQHLQDTDLTVGLILLLLFATLVFNL